MKHQVIRKVILCISCCFVIVFLFFFMAELYAEKEIDVQTAYMASHDINPRTRIEEKDIVSVPVAKAYILNHAVTDKAKIIGKYTDIQGKIPAGSLFYDSMLTDEKDMPDHPSAMLKEGQAAFGIKTDAASMGSLSPGQRADIHLSVTKEDHSVINGCLVEHARIISLKDHQGKEMDPKDDTSVPYMIEFAVNREDLDILELAEASGEFHIYVKSDTYDTSNESHLKEESEVTGYLKSLTENND